MRRLKRPWLLLFPLAGTAFGMVWLSAADRGTAPRSSGPVAARVPGDVAISSSDIGVRLDFAHARVLVYEPAYDSAGEEKIRPPQAHPLDLESPVRSVSRSAREIVVLEANGIRHAFRLAPNGRSVVEQVTPALLDVPAAQEDGFRTFRPVGSASGAPIPRPRVSIRIESDDPRDDLVARSLTADLVNAVHPRLRRSIAPMGLTSEIYFGHVFWDADVWVFPALALLAPEAAAEIPKYRLRTLPQARQNYARWRTEGRATARGKLGTVNYADSDGRGAKFAWESSETGRETVPGPSRFEDHISGSVAWSVGMASDLGLVEEDRAEELRRDVAQFYGMRWEYHGKGLEIRDTVSPDEHHTGDNDLYTNLVAQYATGREFYLPRDGRSFLTYDGDRGKGYKQAAALLAVYPLQYPPAEKEAGVMLDRFAPGVIPNGPAMTDAIHAIVAARIGRADEGLRYWRRSWEGFYDLDRGMFSERRRGTRREYFTTGAAGTLQAVLYGFVGLRVDRAGGVGSLVSKLRNGKELRCSPHLPKGWRSVAISGLSVMGKRYDLTAYGDGRVELRPAASK